MKRQVFRGTKSYSKHREGFQREMDNNESSGSKGFRKHHCARFQSLDPKDGDMLGRTRQFNRLKEQGKSPVVLFKCSCCETRKGYSRARFKRGDDSPYQVVMER